MDTPMHIAAHLVSASVLALLLGGCGYRELKAPCGPGEGLPAAMSYAPVAPSPKTSSPLDQLSVAGIPVADPCGSLRPLNGARPNNTTSISGDP